MEAVPAAVASALMVKVVGPVIAVMIAPAGTPAPLMAAPTLSASVVPEERVRLRIVAESVFVVAVMGGRG
jgi:hypothetical protein